jgi:rfaE bifunctional protein nucleotidyltransferase chain/domain
MARVIENLDEVAAAVDEERRAGRTIALTNGAFDLLHVGHTRSLIDAATRADVLVVALNSDAAIRATKGPDRPVHPLAERMEVIAALGAVDYVTWFDGPTCDHVLDAIRPDLHAKGPDYTPENIPERRTLERLKIPLVTVGDPKDHSTTAIATRQRDDTVEA